MVGDVYNGYGRNRLHKLWITDIYGDEYVGEKMFLYDRLPRSI